MAKVAPKHGLSTGVPRTDRGPDQTAATPNLVAQLNVVVNAGGAVGLRIAAIADDVADLLSLPSIKGATSLEKADEFVSRCQAVAERVGLSLAGEEAALLLGLSGETKGELSSVSRRRAAAEFRANNADFATVDDTKQESYRRRRQPAVLAFFASELYHYCRELARAQDSPGSAGHGERVRFGDINWLDRYERYFGIWTCLYALRVDIDRVLRYRPGQDADREKYQRFLRSSLYWYARFERNLHHFVLSRGGAWLLPNANDTQAIGEAVAAINVNSPFTQEEQSWLARCISRSPERSYDGFLSLIAEEENGRWALAHWTRWFSLCRCGNVSDPDCPVHRLTASCRTYIQLITESSYQVVEWYRELPLNVQGIDLQALSEQMSSIRDYVVRVSESD